MLRLAPDPAGARRRDADVRAEQAERAPAFAAKEEHPLLTPAVCELEYGSDVSRRAL
jgi:hypothetical protein